MGGGGGGGGGGYITRIYEPRHEKTGVLPLQKQRHRSAVLCSNCTADQRLCVRYLDSTISLLLKSEISSF